MQADFKELNDRIAEIDDLNRIQSLLYWDLQTYMPPNGSEARSSQISVLSRLVHERVTSEQIGKKLEDLRPLVSQMDSNSSEARAFVKIDSAYSKLTRIPVEWVSEFSRLTTRAHKFWAQAKAENNFELFRPYLENILEMRRAYSGFFTPYEHIYDPLLDDYEPGMKTSDIKEVFGFLRVRQVELVQAISKCPQVDDSFLYQDFDEKAQWDFGLEVIRKLGFDANNGRQDKSPHPFTTRVGAGDVRITTRFDPGFLNSALFATLHECGHALHSLGLAPEFVQTIFGARIGPGSGGASMALNESQSRLIENLVGRSYQFWQYYYPRLKDYFPAQFQEVSLEDFYKGINQVKPSLIRVEADEGTYNLHIMLRMELEIKLLEGTLAVKDLPAAWSEGMHDYLGLVPPNDSQGVLQDVHWSAGSFGYFPTYALGNLVSAQIWEKILQDLPDINDQIRQASFEELLGWLREKIHRHGTKYTAQELLISLTGSSIDPNPYIDYLTKKYKQIYRF